MARGDITNLQRSRQALDTVKSSRAAAKCSLHQTLCDHSEASATAAGRSSGIEYFSDTAQPLVLISPTVL